MNNNIVYVRRKDCYQGGEWKTFCESIGRSCNEVFAATRVHELYVMVDSATDEKHTFVHYKFYTVDETEYKKSLLNKVPEVDNNVLRPKHYEILDEPTIELLARTSTLAEWRGFCRNNILKYRLRAGKKDKLEQDIGKADEYEVIFKQYKHLCRQE